MNTELNITIAHDKTFTQALSDFGDRSNEMDRIEDEDSPEYAAAVNALDQAWKAVTAAVDGFCIRLIEGGETGGELHYETRTFTSYLAMTRFVHKN